MSRPRSAPPPRRRCPSATATSGVNARGELAVAKIDLELARHMNQKAAWLYDQKLDAAEAANMAKYAAAEAGIQALDCAIQTHGGNGLAAEYGLADLWGMARLLRTAPVSREMILNYVAQHSLGLPRSY